MTIGTTAQGEQDDIAALAKGGRTNFIGFLLRLAGRMPFLFIGGRLYGAAALGRFASAIVVIELVAMLCTLGEKRGLAQRLSDADDEAEHGGIVFDGLATALLASGTMALALYIFPLPLFPGGSYTAIDRLLVLAIPALAVTEIALAAQAYRYDIAATVRARSIVEPWTISAVAAAMYVVRPDSGLAIAYVAAMFAAMLSALRPFLGSYGPPRGWRVDFARMRVLAIRGLPLAGADTIEWGTRRLDILILGAFAQPRAVGIYYAAQQIASVPQKLKTSFEPVLGPVIARNLKTGNYAAVARQTAQVGFWITAMQAGAALGLGVPARAGMGLVGPAFASGAAALVILLAAEVLGSMAVVSEGALIYMDRVRNLWQSVTVIGLQAVTTVAVLTVMARMGASDLTLAIGAAASLGLALAYASFAKSRMLQRMLRHRITIWRWPVAFAAGPALAVGWLVLTTPEWFQLAAGWLIVLAVYAATIWRFGFGPEDRVLFTRNLAKGEAVVAGQIPPPA